jgi:hypothetical protein
MGQSCLDGHWLIECETAQDYHLDYLFNTSPIYCIPHNRHHLRIPLISSYLATTLETRPCI